MGSVGHHEPPRAHLQALPPRREPRLQLLVAPGLRQVAGDLGARPLHVRPLPRALLAAEHPGAAGAASDGTLLPLEPIQVPRRLPEPQLPLQVAQRALHLPPGEARPPRSAASRIDPVDHQMEVGVGSVAVRDDDRLVLRESKVSEKPLRHPQHRLAVRRIRGVEAHREVVDRSARAGAGGGECHDHRGVPDRRRPDVPRDEPRHPPRLPPVAPVLQVGGEVVEARREGLVPDHQSENAPRISRSASVARRASSGIPIVAARSITS